MFTQLTPVILASASPRRQTYLASLGISFDCIPAAISEIPLPLEAADDFAVRLAEEKAAAIGASHANACVIGADTIVVQGTSILGKPSTPAEALAFLQQLRNTPHTVITGVAVLHRAREITHTFSVSTLVHFADYSDAVLKAYVATGDPLDKAGGYGIQSLGGFLVASIEGSYSNVVGLPMAELVKVLLQHNLLATK